MLGGIKGENDIQAINANLF